MLWDAGICRARLYLSFNTKREMDFKRVMKPYTVEINEPIATRLLLEYLAYSTSSVHTNVTLQHIQSPDSACLSQGALLYNIS